MHDFAKATRSSILIILGPLANRISSSETTPHTSVSQSYLHCLRALKWPECIRSKQPSTYRRLTLRIG